MTREKVKELLPAITHFANGGELWYVSKVTHTWRTQSELWVNTGGVVCNVIEDEHFEARKAYALGGEVEYRTEGSKHEWHIADELWLNFMQYRPKPREQVYEWIFYRVNCDKSIALSEHVTQVENDQWIKIDATKRIRR